ncbi:hypothetical protein J8J14_13785 [Roseomonas sp. SSH11]|uniref:Uncharacterized protein n=1 Tax=Pararoseomonas baculiformis TaxID=2820812 RepID=A0ABS4AFR8_9PROT|nr:hypothetical protein [Pararoseomonas baculiformis]MBP0445846.1 hypothetical protein [Pararoseomonas baculiformis]
MSTAWNSVGSREAMELRALRPLPGAPGSWQLGGADGPVIGAPSFRARSQALEIAARSNDPLGVAMAHLRSLCLLREGLAAPGELDLAVLELAGASGEQDRLPGFAETALLVAREGRLPLDTIAAAPAPEVDAMAAALLPPTVEHGFTRILFASSPVLEPEAVVEARIRDLLRRAGASASTTAPRAAAPGSASARPSTAGDAAAPALLPAAGVAALPERDNPARPWSSGTGTRSGPAEAPPPTARPFRLALASATRGPHGAIAPNPAVAPSTDPLPRSPGLAAVEDRGLRDRPASPALALVTEQARGSVSAFPAGVGPNLAGRRTAWSAEPVDRAIPPSNAWPATDTHPPPAPSGATPISPPPVPSLAAALAAALEDEAELRGLAP